ncbi:hypothetical protein KUTeg_021989 [Tegillarca granosa]|uniref:General transcription factor 3C polypeptide 5 n=1 Tax=Tegillarca granosa TaxID=220873 RepID=A0ABQ9E5R8_TEGGR|nr:hypothetical protein KUTeg_021989 [Tegillarca granosa]
MDISRNNIPEVEHLQAKVICEMEKTREWTDSGDLVNADGADRKYLCVEHPAIIHNVDKALKTIGGTENVAKTYSEVNKRLALNWRPNDIFCKPAFAERCQTTSILLKIRRRRRKGDDSGTSDQYQVEFLGDVEVSYRFQGMADFQFLPIVRKDSSQLLETCTPYYMESSKSHDQETGSSIPQYESILDKLNMNTMVDRNEFLSRDVPMYLPPMVFSRFDLPDKAYLFRPSVAHREGYVDPDIKRPQNLIGTVRQKRTVFTVFVNFKDPIPQGPSEFAKTQLAKNCVQYGRKDKLKFILPLCAYYYLTGPWRCLWVRFGYDPQKDPKAKIYQSVDFRKRQTSIGDPVGIKCKRGENIMAFPSNTRTQPNYVYTADKIPPCRQMYYQLCDLLVDEIQYMIKKNDGKEKVCDERDGWCVTGVIDRCRDIISENTRKILVNEDKFITNAVHKKRHWKKKRRPEYKSDSEDEEVDMNSMLEDDMNVMETELLDCP